MNTTNPLGQTNTFQTTDQLTRLIEAVDEKNRWRQLYDYPMPTISSLNLEFDQVGSTQIPLSPFYIGKSIEYFKNPLPFAQEVPGIEVIAEDIRIVLVLDNTAAENVVNGINIAAGVFAAFAAASGTIAAVTGLANFVPAAFISAVIAGVAGVFSGFLWAGGAIINSVNIGNGVYLTVSVPQFVAAATIILSGLLFPPYAPFAAAAAALVCVPIPTSR